MGEQKKRKEKRWKTFGPKPKLDQCLRSGKLMCLHSNLGQYLPGQT